MLDTRVPEVYWMSKNRKRGMINEVKVGNIGMSTGQTWKQMADDWDLKYVGWGIVAKGPFKGKHIPVTSALWWFFPNRGGVTNPSPAVMTNLEEDGINSVVIDYVPGAPPPPPKKQSRKQQDQEAQELESGQQGEIQQAVDTLFGPPPFWGCVR